MALKNNNNAFANIMLSNAMSSAIMVLSHFGSVAHFDRRAMAEKKAAHILMKRVFISKCCVPFRDF